jgi:hypothetical protein
MSMDITIRVWVFLWREDRSQLVIDFNRRRTSDASRSSAEQREEPQTIVCFIPCTMGEESGTRQMRNKI